jgi:hypothetical protein
LSSDEGKMGIFRTFAPNFSTSFFLHMKIPLLLLAVSGSTMLAAHAQTTIGRGTGLLTGSVGYHADTRDVSSSGGSTVSKVTYRTFGINLAVGGFVADNLALGVQLSHTVTGGSYSSSNNNQPSPPSSYTLRVGPMAQYYKMLSEQFGITAMLGVGYESNLDRTLQYYQGYPYPYPYFSSLKTDGYYAALTPGIVFFPVPKFGLTATIGSLSYNRLKVKDNGSIDEVVSSFDAGFGFEQLQFGASYYFGRK